MIFKCSRFLVTEIKDCHCTEQELNSRYNVFQFKAFLSRLVSFPVNVGQSMKPLKFLEEVKLLLSRFTTKPLWDLHTNCVHQEFPVEAKK